MPRIWLAEGGDDSDHARIMRVRKCAAGDSQADGELPGLRALQTLRTALESARRELDVLRGDGPLGRREESLPAEVDFGALSGWLLSGPSTSQTTSTTVFRYSPQKECS